MDATLRHPVHIARPGRPGRSLRVTLVALLLLAAVPFGPAAQAVTPSSEDLLVRKLNEERHGRGLAPLVVNVRLREVARDWSANLASSGALAHNPHLGSEVDERVTDEWRRIGENVGYRRLNDADWRQLANMMHNALMASDGHRANILGDYNQVGVGVTIASDGTMWVVQDFINAPIRDADVVAPDPDPAPGPAPDGEVYALSGDWNGDGRSTPGWYQGGRFRLRNSLSHGPADITFNYGRDGDVPIAGDWNGDGTTTVGILRGGVWHLRNSNTGGPADLEFRYGRLESGDYALAGDWNGDGTDTVGIVRGGEWHLRNVNRGGAADVVFTYGRVRSGDVPVVGDWTGDGIDTPGIVRGGEWHLRDVNRGGVADKVFLYGRSSDRPVVGNWNSDGPTTVGIVRGTEWHLKDAHRGGAADHTFRFAN
jgi:uncharacterized protein YkwD